ncbi:MAG TPA: tRNA uridine-5-carboxymethylaminomethyl(34) synthesis GTPase MnmE, partial [Blastocatellia bacterium]|nr:tRNA uridine-5-carboxymethylaminomethyl(34) synthesis GTPase MnmE [Blastocatellia bacterium]
MHSSDTIVAISTPPGRGAIGIIRLSGPASFDIARTLFRTAAGTPLDLSNHAYVGRIAPPGERENIDEAITTLFKAPHSYTGEDVIEISCHGSPIVMRRVLDLCVALSARLAEPGEFTLRAFLNRRMDLAQAQAVRDLIDARTSYQARLATRQLGGALSKRLEPLKQSLIEVVVHMESSIEFVEDDISPARIRDLVSTLERLIEELSGIASSFSFGRYVKEGFDLAIVGRPNVGKSSVFNRLAGSERAIVTEVPGTTRDALYESSSILGVPVRLIDTAGIRETTDLVETIGITRTRTAMADADITLVVLDNSEPLSPDDLSLFDQIEPEARMVVLNKCDLPRRIDGGALNSSGASGLADTLNVSALTGEGFDTLTGAIFHRLAGGSAVERDDVMITDARQHQA